MEVVGNIHIQSLLSAGQWAQTYRGYDHELKREAVVKIFTPAALGDPTIRARYQREIQLVNSLAHPSIVPIYGFGEENERMYIVMPFLPGGSLADRLHRGPIAPDEAALMIQRLAAALDAVHALDIVHGDLKPSNILFDQNGFPMLSDFGMIKFGESIAANLPGAIVGPPATLSPERSRGEPSQPAGDIYALGLLFYQMLGGEMPFADGSAVQAILAQQFRERQPLSGALAAFEAIVARATHLDPNQRYLSAGAFSEAISDAILAGAGSIQETVTDLPPVASPPPRRTWLGQATRRQERPAKPARAKKKRARRKPPPVAWVYTRFILLLVLLILLALTTGVYLRSVGYQQSAILPQEIERMVRNLVFPQPTYPSQLSPTPSPTPSATLPAPSPTSRATLEAIASPTPLPTRVLPTATLERPLTPEPFGQALDHQLVTGELLFEIAGRYHVDFSEMLDAQNLTCDAHPPGINLIYIPQPHISRRSLRPAALNTTNAADFSLVQTLDCMTDVNLIELSPDGNVLAVAAGEDIYLWDAQDWTPLHILRGHLQDVTALDFSLNSQQLASGSADTMVKLWDVGSGELVRTIYDHESRITGIRYNRTGTLLATLSINEGLIVFYGSNLNASVSNTFTGGLSLALSPVLDTAVVGFEEKIALYSVTTTSILETASMDANQPATWMVISPDGRLAVSGNEVWHILELQHLYDLDKPGGRVVFSPDSQTFFGGGRFWTTTNGRSSGDLNTAGDPSLTSERPQVHSAVLTPDGMYLIWANQERVSVWALPESYQPQAASTEQVHIATQADTRASIANQFGVSLSGLLSANGMDCGNPIFEGQRLVIPSDPAAAYANFDLNQPIITSANALRLQPVHEMEMTCTNISGELIFSPDDRLLISGSAIWDVSHRSVLVQAFSEKLRAEGSPLTPLKDVSPLIALAPDQQSVAIRINKEIQVWDLNSGYYSRSLNEHQGDITSLAFSPDGQLLASGGAVTEPSIRIWRFSDGKLEGYITGFAIQRLNFSQDSQQFFGETLDTFRLWNVGEKEPVFSLTRSDKRAVLTADHKLIAYVSGNYIHIHDLVQNVELHDRLAGERPGFQSLQFTQDGKFLAAANDHGVAIWNVQTGELVHWLEEPAGRTKVNLITLSPDGSLVAVVANPVLRIWEIETESVVFQSEVSAVSDMTFSPGGQFLALLTDLKIILWGVAP